MTRAGTGVSLIKIAAKETEKIATQSALYVLRILVSKYVSPQSCDLHTDANHSAAKIQRSFL